MESKMTAARGQVRFLPFSPCPTTLQVKYIRATPPRRQGDQGMSLLITLAAGGPLKM